MRGVKFGTKHTYTDWGLLLAAYPVVAPPEPQTKLVTVPARDGQINLTKALDGYIHYNSRKVTIKLLCYADREQWTEIYSQVLNTVQGQELNIVLDDIPDCYLHGVFEVSAVSYKNKFYTLTITGECDPYMYEINTSDTDWQWDAFNFEEGVIRDYTGVTVDGTLDYTITGSKRPSRPRFYVSSGTLTVTYNGTEYALPTGTATTIPKIYLGDGEYTLTFKGTGTVTVIYQGGRM